MFAAGGAALSLLENALPRPLPWMRIGLANVATLLALYLYSARAALSVALLRVLLGGVLGRGFGPGFLLSAGGGLAAWGAMSAVRGAFGRAFSVVGVSVWGALAHNLTQLTLAHLVIVRTGAIWGLLPAFLWAAGVAGVVTGVLAYSGLKLLE
ncbi:MAG TPA: heptaprenyl diphosphate synthase [Candidatus Latescibacteria bacterium]|nr:heptaprenyl diphosphate synthase [Candidatus Latescibacterota bacterium]